MRHPQPVSRALAVQLTRTWCIVVAGSLAACYVAQQFAGRRQVERQALAQAQTLAAAMVPGPDGDLTDSFWDIRERTGTLLLALGELDSRGNLIATYPNRPAHRRSLQVLLRETRLSPSGTWNGNRAIRMTVPSPEHGHTLAVMGAVVPMRTGGAASGVRRLAVLLRPDGARAASAVLPFALPFGLWTAGVLVLLHRWFVRRVVRPLRNLTSLASANEPPRERTPVRIGPWRETGDLARMFCDLSEAVARSHAKNRQMERDASQRLRTVQGGLERQLRRARDRVYVDPLTQLLNRAFLEDNLEKMFEAQRKRDAGFAVVVLDVDNFKQHNDTCGHHAGDALLRFVGALLQGATRAEDRAVRYGGDEFVLLLPEATEREAGSVAERTVKLFGQYTKRLGEHNQMSLSAGVAVLHDHASGHDLVAAADQALYAAKRRGKNGVALAGVG